MDSFTMTKKIQIQAKAALYAYNCLYALNKDFPFKVLGKSFESIRYFTCPLDVSSLALTYEGEDYSFVAVSEKEVGNFIKVPDINKAMFKSANAGEEFIRDTPKILLHVSNNTAPSLIGIIRESIQVISKKKPSFALDGKHIIHTLDNFEKSWRDMED